MSEKSLVFEQWIVQHSGLKLLLQGAVPSTVFRDDFSWLEHSLRDDFANYLSSFSAKILSNFSALQSQKDLAKVVSYLVLFAGDDRQFLEQKLTAEFFQNLKKNLNSAENVRSELELLEISEKICNEDSIILINQLSRKSYPLKVQFVDEVLRIIHFPQCTARLAYRLVKQLKELELNPEHRATVLKVEEDLKSGELLPDKRRKKVSFTSFVRPLLFLLVLAGLCVGIYYFVEYNKQQEKDDLNIASSFEDFSVEERKQIDSLIQTMKPQQEIEKEDDIFQWLGNGVVLSIRQPLSNERMERLYNDWLLDAALIENAKVDTCSATNNKLFPGVLSLSKLKGKEKVMLRNESQYQSFVFVFDDFRSGKVYSELLEKGKTITFHMNENQGILVVPGNRLSTFKAPKTASKDECPSSDFTVHFCEADNSLNLSLSSMYRLSLPTSPNKLMLVGDSTTQFSVIDLNGILEEF